MPTDRELECWREGFATATEAVRIGGAFTKQPDAQVALNGMAATLERTRDDFEAKWVARQEEATER